MRNSELVKAYIDSTAQSIDGWFYPLDMLLFAYLGEVQECCGFEGHLCEVGVYFGKSLALLSLMSAPDERVFGFDLFEDGRKEKTLQTLRAAYGGRVAAQLVAKNSLDCAPEYLRTVLTGPLRFLHVDAGHEFHEALSDLRNFSSFLSPIGVIAVDDYYDRAFPGVAAATHAFVEHGNSTQFVPFVVGQNKIYLCNPALAGHYQRMLILRPPFRDNLRVQRMYNHPVLIPFAGKLASPAHQIRPLLAP